jgi:anti-sigma-K factor RskA
MSDARDHAAYADWDGAYVLGALSPADRREFETHLETCDRCRLAVADLSGLPGLLGRVDPARAFALLEEETPDLAVPPPPADLVARIERAEHRRRTRRWGVVAGLAAAVVVAAAIAVPVTIATRPHPAVSVALSPTTTSPLSAQVDLTSVRWGTRIDMHCAYATENAWGDPEDEGDWSYALWVVDAKGTASEVSTWKATSGSQVRLSAGTALTVDDIAAVQVRSVTTGDVLLTKRL